MNEQYEALLCSRYSEIFSARESSAGGSFGFRCGDGWFPLIDAACELIQKYGDAPPFKQFNALLVSEQFGMLRFYYKGGTEYAASVVDLVENLSRYVCEVCSAPGRRVSLAGKFLTRCSVHDATSSYDDLVRQRTINRVLVAPSLAEVLGTALEFFFRDSRLTAEWLTHSVLALGNMPPFHLLGSVEGQRKVLTLLRRLEFGVLL